MPVGTAGDDSLSNDPNEKHDSVDGLGGDDVVEILEPTDIAPSSPATVTVDGGPGEDTLLISGRLGHSAGRTGQPGADSPGTGITLHVGPWVDAPVQPLSYHVSYDGIEYIEFVGTGTPGEIAFFGDTHDFLLFVPVDGIDFVWVHTGGGDDVVVAGAPAAIIRTEAGDDMVDLSCGCGGLADVDGGAGSDLLISGDAADSLFGGVDDDFLIGMGGADILGGGGGDDLIEGGSGIDRMTGGAGDDVYLVEEELDVVAELEDEGFDTVFSLVSYELDENVEDLWLVGTDPIDGTGNGLDNLIFGNDSNNALSGGGGDDLLDGGDGFDLLDGGAGADTMAGGARNDVYVVDDGGDVVIEDPDGGADRVYVSARYHALAANVENLVYTGAGNFSGYGNGLDNQMIGGSGNDYLRGGDGNDSLEGRRGNDIIVGGAGADIMSGGAGADRFVFAGGSTGSGAGADRISDFASGSDLIDLSQIDADRTAGGDQAFTYVGALQFTGTAGELRFESKGNLTWIEGDTDGDSIADLQIFLDGTVVPLATDFIA